MTLAIMQPYFFPYIGYWQLINAVDTFVIYDDINFIKQGYINRNAILVGKKTQRITLEVIGAGSSKIINEVEVGGNAKKLLKSIDQAYKKAPEHEKVFPLIQSILEDYSSWERGLNEYTNGLIRQYFPKGSSFTDITPERIQEVEDKLNHRPRKTLGWKTPYEVFYGLEKTA